MTFKKLFSTGLLLVLFLITGVVNAQVGTYWVKFPGGNDANPGTSEALAKATVASALIAAPSGSTIRVVHAGSNYTEATVVVTNTYTFESQGGTPIFNNGFQVGTAPTAGTITFAGPFQFNGLTLQNGTLAGGNNITIAAGALVTRTEVSSITSGQLVFAGTANFDYVDAVAGASSITTGLEFPTATNVANNLTTTATSGNITLILNQNRQINGILTTGAGVNNGGLDLATFTLTINGANAHTIDGDVVSTGGGGLLSFVLTGAASLDGVGARAIGNVTASATAANTLTLDPAGGGTLTTVGAITANTNANITTNNTGNTGAVTLNGAGTINVLNGGTVGAVLGAAGSTGIITLANTTAAGATIASITQSGLGAINFTGTAATTITITTNVVLNTAFTLPIAPAAAYVGLGTITFLNLPTVISGALTNSASFTGATDRANNTSGNIIFGNTTTTVSVTGLTTNSSTGGWTVLAGPGALTTSGRITFATTTGALTFTGGITNSSTLNGTAPVGDVIAAGAGGAATVNAGAVLNSSTQAPNNIDFSNLTGVNTLASVTSSGATTGGDIIFGNGNVAINAGNVENSRGAAGADITFGLAGTGGTTVTINNLVNSGVSNITFVSTTTGAVTINNNTQQTGTGTTIFPNATTAVFSLRNFTVNAGLFDFTNAAATGAVNVTGTASLTNGTIDFGTGVRALTFSGASISIGGNGTAVTFNNSASTTMDFNQPIPNVIQTVTLSTLNQLWPGIITVTNPAVLPAPYVKFVSAGGAAAAGNLYILNTALGGNGLTFNTGGLVLNTVELDNARIYVGMNNPGGAPGGGFQNTTGYSTINGGFVMMSGNAAQVVNAANPTAGATFGNFGVDNNAGGVVVTFGANANLAVIAGSSEFYLAEGTVAPANLQFNGAAPWPTVFRTEGTFNANIGGNIAGGTRVNVTYYGNDKATANELPNTATGLNNLTVATTNGAQPGQGIVTMTAPTQVNGTLTINAGQAFYLQASPLTMNGEFAVINGYLVEDNIPGVDFHLSRPLGTTFSGNGWLPSIQVNAGSTGNTITGRGLVFAGFGGDGVWGGVGANADDFTTMDGVVTYAGGAASSLTATFSAPVLPSTTNFLNLTTGVGATFNLGANAIMGGNMTHPAGAINLSTFNLTNNGTAPTMTAGATLVGTGSFIMPTAGTTFTGAGLGGPTIAANVICNNNGGIVTLAGTNLRIDGNFTLGTATPTPTSFANGGFNLTLGGLNVTFYSTSAITGAGTTILLNTAPNTLLTWTVPAAANPAVTNLTVNGNVTLTGAASLLVNGVGTGFVMNAPGGTLTLGGANLNVGAGGATPFNYQAGTISGTGFVVWNSLSTWTQGTGAVAAPLTLTNLEVQAALDITNGNANLIGSTLTLNNSLYLNAAVMTHARTVAPTGTLLTLAAAPFQIRVAGAGNLAASVPNFLGTVNYLFTGAASNPNAFTWPANQANNVTLNTTGGAIVTNSVSRTIFGNVDLTSGVLRWDSPVGLTLTDGTTVTRRLNASRLDRDANLDAVLGGFTVGNINLAYQQTLAGDVITTDIEYSIPTVVNNFALLATTAGAGNQTQVTIAAGAGAAAGYSRTVSGTLSMASILNINVSTVWTLAQTIGAGHTVAVGAATATWNGGLTVNGTYTNGVTGTTVVVGNLAGTGAVNNFNVFTLGGLNLTGASNLTLGNASTTTLTGDATIAGFTPPAFVAGAPAEVGATISTNSNITFGAAAWAGAGNLLNLTFTGTNNQTVGLGANRQLNNVTMNKGNDGTVTFSGGNLTLNPVQDGGIQPAGVLTLTRGIVVMTDPTLLTLQLTVNAGGIITNLGYVRNPAQTTHFAHVTGRLGVFIPAGTIGRSEWPVGTANPSYRPAAITFTAGNATIAPTTIVVSHVNTMPTGTKNFPINGGTKFADPSRTNWIGGKAPYYWVFEATVSLGAAQLMNVELNGTNLNRPLDNHNDLRIIRRFDGDVTVNGWFLEGNANNYSNAMYINTPLPGDTLLVVRNIGSVGSAVAQRAFFTLGIPSGAPIFTATAPASVVTPENALYTFDFDAIDNDVNVGAPTFSLVSNPPTGAAIVAATGVFTWTPTFDQGRVAPYPITVRATKANDATVFTDYTFNITVTNVNRAPTWTGGTTHATATVVQGQTLNLTYAAVDPDGDALTYTRTVAPAPAGANSIAGGVLTFTPTLADAAGGPYVFTITASDGALTANTTTSVTVTYGRNKGDVDGDGDIDGIDASLVLQHVVGKTSPAPLPLTGVALWAADCNSGVGDGVVGAYDAYLILYKVLNPTLPFPPKISAAMGKVELGRLSGENGIINVPITLSNTIGVTSTYVELETGSLEAASVKVTSADGWVSSTNTEGGKVRIALTGLEPLKDGVIAVVSFKLNGQESVTVRGSAVLNDDLREELNSVNVREIPTEFALSQNYPNPFNPTTSIKYSLAENAKVTLVIYDMLGQVVKTLIDNEQEAGFYTVKWDGTNNYGGKVSSGIYIYRLNAGKFMSTLKMNLLK
jgi:hypothetical protein